MSIFRAFGAVLSILIFAACQTTQSDPTDFESSQLSGLVYDYAGQPIKDVVITLDDVPAAVSDVNGHFILADVARGGHTIVAEGRDLEPLEVSIEFRSRRDILYLRMYSLANLLDKANAALLNSDFLQAQMFLDRASTVSPTGPQVAYLRAIFHLKLGDPEAAFGALELVLNQRLYGAPVVQLLKQIASQHPQGLEKLASIADRHPLILMNRDFAEFLQQSRN